MQPNALPDLDIVIVNWNTGRLLAECIRSIAGSLNDTFRLRGVWVIDNGSTDESLAFESPDALSVRVIRNTSNRGFAAACNQGVFAGQASFVLLLNPDTRLFAESLARPIGFLAKPANHPFAICGVQLVDDTGKRQPCVSRFPTVLDYFNKTFGLSKLFPSVCRSVVLPAGEPEQSGSVDQVMGAFMLIRRRTYEAL